MKLFYSAAYTASSHAFDTTRKARWVAESLVARPIAGIELCEPQPLSAQQLETIHDPEYVAAARTGEPRRLAESQGFSWDAQLWAMVCASNGGTLEAAREARRGGRAGSLSSGLHHARRKRGAGFCTFNGLALAAKTLLNEGAQSVLILDFDAHCGGGTYSLIKDEPRIWQADVATDSFDRYTPKAQLTLDIVSDAAKYLPTIWRRLAELETRAPQFDLCLYNAGMDPSEKCGTGGLRGIDEAMLAEREELVFSWCHERKIPIAFVLAGGYIGGALNEAGLVDLHRLTLTAAVETLKA